METCAFCSKEAETRATSVTDNYCIDCHLINISESKKAVKELRMSGVRKTRCNAPNSKQTLDEALDNLMNGP